MKEVILKIGYGNALFSKSVAIVKDYRNNSITAILTDTTRRDEAERVEWTTRKKNSIMNLLYWIINNYKIFVDGSSYFDECLTVYRYTELPVHYRKVIDEEFYGHACQS